MYKFNAPMCTFHCPMFDSSLTRKSKNDVVKKILLVNLMFLNSIDILKDIKIRLNSFWGIIIGLEGCITVITR